MGYSVENLAIKRNVDGNILKNCETIAESEDKEQYIKNKNENISHPLVLGETQNETIAISLAH